MKPGDLVFCHSTGIVGRAIRLGERLRFRSGDFWNHVAIVATTGPDPLVIQAESRGVTSTAPLSTVAPGGSYEVVELPESCEAVSVLAFADAQVGQEYGFLSIAGLAVRILTPQWLPIPTVRMARTWICSALGAESARAGGWVNNWGDVYTVVPSELYAAIKGIDVRDAASFSAANR